MCMVIDMEHLYHVIYSSCNAIVHNSNPTPDPNNNYKPSATIINLSFITIPRAFQPRELVALGVGFSKFVVVLGDPTSRPKDGLLRERQVPSCRVLLEKARSTDVLDLSGDSTYNVQGILYQLFKMKRAVSRTTPNSALMSSMTVSSLRLTRVRSQGRSLTIY